VKENSLKIVVKKVIQKEIYDNKISKDENCGFRFIKYSDEQSKQLGDWIQCQGNFNEWYHEFYVGGSRPGAVPVWKIQISVCVLIYPPIPETNISVPILCMLTLN
jgi:hypothetical protein